MDITPKKRAITVALKKQTSMTVRDIAHSVSKSSVSKLLKTHSKTGSVSPKLKG
jgi:hypothetical protein